MAKDENLVLALLPELLDCVLLGKSGTRAKTAQEQNEFELKLHRGNSPPIMPEAGISKERILPRCVTSNSAFHPRPELLFIYA
jgi:hypothetical protein